jgi:hypothetical protein
LESSFRIAYDWLNATGQGLREKGTLDEKSIKEVVLRKCNFFNELHKVMMTRNSTKPLTTNHEVQKEMMANVMIEDSLIPTFIDDKSNGEIEVDSVRKALFEDKIEVQLQKDNTSSS